MAYSDKVLDHYNHPRNVGSFDKSDPNVGTGMVGAPECGDVMKLQVKVNPETGVIEDAKFRPSAVQRHREFFARHRMAARQDGKTKPWQSRTRTSSMS